MEKDSIGGWGGRGGTIEFQRILKRDSGDERELDWWSVESFELFSKHGGEWRWSRFSASSAPHEPSLKTASAAVLVARRGGKAVRERGRRLKRWAREAASQRRFTTRTARLCAAVASPPSACRAGARPRVTPRGCVMRASPRRVRRLRASGSRVGCCAEAALATTRSWRSATPWRRLATPSPTVFFGPRASFRNVSR